MYVGHTYERSAIEAWFAKGKDTSPKTNLKLKNLDLAPNFIAKQAIADYKQRHGK